MNILLDNDFDQKLSDFGIVKLDNDLEQGSLEQLCLSREVSWKGPRAIYNPMIIVKSLESAMGLDYSCVLISL